MSRDSERRVGSGAEPCASHRTDRLHQASILLPSRLDHGAGCAATASAAPLAQRPGAHPIRDFFGPSEALSAGPLLFDAITGTLESRGIVRSA